MLVRIYIFKTIPDVDISKTLENGRINV